MRNRHMARVCHNCQAPMASGEDTCWRCGVEWTEERQPPATLRLVEPMPADAQPALGEVAAAALRLP
jgi:predicted amidophosphoribosyltransferase